MNLLSDWITASGLASVIPLLIGWANIVAKSTLIIAVPVVISLIAKYRRNSQLKHLIWLQALIGVALIPLLTPVLSQLGESWLANRSLITINVSPVDSPTDMLTNFGIDWSLSWYSIFYLIPTIILGLRLISAYSRVRRIAEAATVCTNPEAKKILNQIVAKIGIKASVELKYSGQTSSPFSFGLMNPEIILPVNAGNWSPNLLEDVLVHELTHIKRLDWLSMLVSHSIACVFWFNPLCWVAKSKLDEEAENCCDSAVLEYGKLNTEYAENLIRIARQSRDEQPLLAQMLISKSKFNKRIKLILEGNMKILNNKYIRYSFSVLVTLAVLIGAGTQVLSAQAGNREYYPINAPIPPYPTIAVEQELEGHVLLQFTVEETGAVDVSSIVVLDESPAGIFSNSAINAAETFTFSPRVEDGLSVEVLGVQYMFRYVLDDG